MNQHSSTMNECKISVPWLHRELMEFEEEAAVRFIIRVESGEIDGKRAILHKPLSKNKTANARCLMILKDHNIRFEEAYLNR